MTELALILLLVLMLAISWPSVSVDVRGAATAALQPLTRPSRFSLVRHPLGLSALLVTASVVSSAPMALAYHEPTCGYDVRVVTRADTKVGPAAVVADTPALVCAVGTVVRAVAVDRATMTPEGLTYTPNAARHACSFSGETRVLMADGSTKPISQVEVGDVVLAEDPETGERGPREVTRLWVHGDTLVELEIDGELITTTKDHPFWNHTDSEWQRVDGLGEGDLVLTADGEFLAVDGLVAGSAQRGLAYNLTVDGIHTYYVGIGGDEVLVHNTCGMLGAGGTQVTSKTLANRPGYRIDVENPAPGVRPGQLHLQDSAGGKYLYDFEAGQWTRLPRSIQRQIADDPAVARAIATGRRYLGLDP